MRLLLLTSGLPWPFEMHGGAQRTRLLLDALQEIATVDLAIVTWSPETIALAREVGARACNGEIVGTFEVARAADIAPDRISQLPIVGSSWNTVRRYVARYAPDRGCSDWLAEVVERNRYDAVVSRFLWPGARSDIARITAVPTLLDWDDIDHKKFATQVRESPWRGIRGTLTQNVVISRLKAATFRLASSFDHVWLAKDGDDPGIDSLSVSVLPNIPYPEEDTAGEVLRHGDIVFVGNHSYLPNADALSGFLADVWPLILKQRPATRLLAIGPPPSAEIARGWQAASGVEITGPVPLLGPYYRQAALSICPVKWGGGSNIKAVESLGYGVPCVMSPYSYAAFKADFDDDRGMICRDNPEAFAQACVELLEDPSRRAAIGHAGQEVVRSRYSVSHFRRVVRDGLTSAGVQKGL